MLSPIVYTAGRNNAKDHWYWIHPTPGLNISGGKFETADEEILIRAWGRNYYAPELYDLPVRGDEGGSVVYLRDIATVTEQWEDIPDKRYYNDQPAVILNLDQYSVLETV